MSMEDPNVPMDSELEEAPAPAGPNRTFIYILIGLGVLMFVMLAGIAGVFLLGGNRTAARATEVAAREATNAAVQATNEFIVAEATQSAINRAATADAIATQAAIPNTPTPTETPIPTETPFPTETPLPSETPTEVVGTPDSGQGGGVTGTPGTPIVNTPDAGQAGSATATPTRLAGVGGTATATPLVGGLTRTPSPTALPNTGFADEASLPMLLVLTLALGVVILIARRLRMHLR